MHKLMGNYHTLSHQFGKLGCPRGPSGAGESAAGTDAGRPPAAPRTRFLLRRRVRKCVGKRDQAAPGSRRPPAGAKPTSVSWGIPAGCRGCGERIVPRLARGTCLKGGRRIHAPPASPKGRHLRRRWSAPQCIYIHLDALFRWFSMYKVLYPKITPKHPPAGGFRPQ